MAERAVELNSRSGMFWRTLGWAEYRAGNWQESIEALKKACEVSSGGNEWEWFFLAMAYWQLEDRDAAMAWFEKAARYLARFKPEAPEPYRFRDEAEELLAPAKMLREAIERAGPHIVRGKSLKEQGQFAEAEQELREAARLDEGNAETHELLANTLAELNKVNEAKESLQEAIRVRRELLSMESRFYQPRPVDNSQERTAGFDANLARIYHKLGTLLLSDARDFVAAEEAFRHALAFSAESNATFLNSLALALRGQQKFAEAETAFRKAIELHPSWGGIHCSLALTLKDQKKLTEAEVAFREAIRLDPESPWSHQAFGVFLFERGRLVESEAAYREAIRLDPDDFVRLNHFANTLRKLGKYEEAVTTYGQALRLDPSAGWMYERLGQTLTKLNRIDEAEGRIRRSSTTGPGRDSLPQGRRNQISDDRRSTTIELRLAGRTASPRDLPVHIGRSRAAPTAMG